MRILTITNYFPPNEVGGAEISAYHTCYGLRRRGIETPVLTINARMPNREDRYYHIQGISVHRVFHRPYLFNNALVQTFDPRVYRDVLAELRRIRPNLVHIHNLSGASLAPLTACRRLGVPVVLTLHDHWLLCPNNMLYRLNGGLCDPARPPAHCNRCFRRYDYWAGIPQRRRIFAHFVRNVRFFTPPSRKLIDLHVAAGYDRARFRLLPYGIGHSLARPPADPRVTRIVRERGLFRRVLFAGAVVETKGVQTLIEALPLLTRYLDRFRLLIAGAGDERFMTALRRFQPTVEMLGRLPFREMRALYAAAELTVAPSTWYDNSPMVIYESLLTGTPVLGSAIGGIPELIREGETGYLVPPGEAVALAEAIIRHFALSAYERRTMRRRCIAYAGTHLTLDRHIDRLLRIYHEALS